MKKRIVALLVCCLMMVSLFAGTALAAANDQQIVDAGGASPSDGTLNLDGVSVSKTLEGTDLENYFDITLSITTTTEMKTLVEKQNCAVVIVLDQSRTMNADHRLDEAKVAAKEFVDSYCVVDGAVKTNNLLGFVVFDTDATTLFPVGTPSSENISDWKNKIDNIQTESAESTERYTNIEAGLQLGYNLLKDVNAVSKHIILLTDGFPTTYVSTDRDSRAEIQGYNPESSVGKIGDDGYFYDAIKKQVCWGTSYSDKAAAKAQTKAAEIKSSSITIFSVGVDIGGQTIQKYVEQNAPVVDRTSTTYVIGGDSDENAYKNWLRTSIGSNSYCDGDDLDALKTAYTNIVTDIERMYSVAVSETWFASDPMGGNIEFQYFFDKDGAVAGKSLTGSNTEGGEDTASFDSKINWDLKNSGYAVTQEGDKTHYTYSIKYRVRLTNEASGFVEEQAYATNGTTTLKYKVIEDGVLGEEKTMEFPIPGVKGYLAEIGFNKIDEKGEPLPGAEFTLSHNSDCCSVAVADKTAVSDSEGKVAINGIPSGHRYTLKESKVPAFYVCSSETYPVEVSYGVVTFEKEGGSIVNTPATTEINFTKVNAKDEPLAGAEFTLSHNAECCAAQIADMVQVSDEEGKVAFTDLYNGHIYTLKETKAPEGYLLSDETYYVTVSDGKASFEKNGSFIVNDAIPPAPTPWVPVIPMPTPTPTPTPGGDEIIDEEDVPLAGLPNTGDNGSGFLGIAITATVILAAGAVVLCRRRRTR